MDKDKFLEIYRKFITRTADNQDAKILVENYCREMGKDSEESAIFAESLKSSGLPLNYNNILEYYVKKFNVMEIYDQYNNLITITY